MRLNVIGIILFVSFNVAAYEYKVENNTPRPIKVELEVGLPPFTDSQKAEVPANNKDDAKVGTHIFKFKGRSAGYCFRALKYNDAVVASQREFTKFTKKAGECKNMHFIIHEKYTKDGDKVEIK